MTNSDVQRLSRLLAALVLGLGLCLLLSDCLRRAGSGSAVAPEDEGVALSRFIPDPRVAVLISQITTGTLIHYERALTGEDMVLVAGRPYTLATRNSYSGEPISQATRYAYEHFQGLGLDVAFHEYTHTGNHWRNVVAEKPGLRRNEEIYLMTAHLDDLPAGPVAPGADDNASGSIAVLVAADLLSRLDFDCTLRFVLFTGEEQGLWGSAAYAADIAVNGDDVRGVLNLDMIGYNSDSHPVVDLHARSAINGSMTIAETFSQVVTTYGLNLEPDILVDVPLGNYSDNRSFWNHGYPAILAIEDWDDTTPYYHTVADTLDTLDLGYFAEFVRAGVATFAHMGCLGTGLLTGTVTALDTGLPLSATVTASTFAFAYTETTNPNGYYSLSLPIYTFTVRAQANVAGYAPATVTNLSVLLGLTRVQRFALQPWLDHLFMPVLLKQP